MPYIPLFEPSLGPPGLPAEPQTPLTMPSSKHGPSSIWGPPPVSSPLAHWPDAQVFDPKTYQAQVSPVHVPVPRFPAQLKLSDDYPSDKNKSPPGAVGEGRTKTSAERTVRILTSMSPASTQLSILANGGRRAAAQESAP